jgi:peptide/nickel transport system substrate-binding protein
MAINRRELIQVLNYPEDTPIFDGLSSWRRAHRQYLTGKLGEPLSYNPETAKRLLEAAGWHDQDADGVRERAGEVGRFTMLVGGGGILSGLELAIYIQEQLRRVGIQMDIRLVDRRVARDIFRTGEFDAAIRSFENNPVSLLRLQWFGTGSPIDYTNPVLVRLLRKLEFTIDPEAQDRLYRELWELFSVDMPVTFLFPWPETFAAHRRLQGLSIPHRANPITYMEELWLEEED